MVTSGAAGNGAGEPEMLELSGGVKVAKGESAGVTVTGTSTTRVTSWVTSLVTRMVANCVTWVVWMMVFSAGAGNEIEHALPRKTNSKETIKAWKYLRMVGVGIMAFIILTMGSVFV
jgi:hypothetical protein